MATKKAALLGAAVAAVCVSLAGCACTGTRAKSAGEAGITLEYSMRPEQTLHYRTSTELTQNTEVGGKPVEVSTTQGSVVTVRSVAASGPDFRVSVTIDSMQVRLAGPGLDLAPDMAGVVGRRFEMSLSPLGEEGDFPGVDAIEIDLGPQGKRSAIAMFKAMFPDLAGRPVAIGDAWTSRDSVTEGAEGQEIQIEMESRHVLEGFEVLDGRECARVRSTLAGTIQGSGSQGPARWATDGALKGASTWYFAAKDGLFVRERSEIHGESTVTAERPGAETMVLPVTTTTVVETTLAP